MRVVKYLLTMCALRHARLLRVAGDQPHTTDVYQRLGFFAVDVVVLLILIFLLHFFFFFH